MQNGDFHTHSTFDDGKSTLREMAEAAYRLGMKRFGFSGHSYTDFDDSFCMPKARVQDYLDTARTLQSEYAGKMEILVGLELDLFGEKPEGLDYVIGSVHYVRANGRCYSVDDTAGISADAVREGFSGDWYRYTDAYFDLVAKLPEVTGCQWIGHFDLPAKFNQKVPAFDEESPRYLRRALEVMEYLVRLGIPFEVNTGAMSRGYRTVPYPSAVLLKYLHEFGGEVILNSDAHHVSHLGYAFKESEMLLAAAGFDHRLVLTRDGMAEVPLAGGRE